jgi:hypothetical protein
MKVRTIATPKTITASISVALIELQMKKFTEEASGLSGTSPSTGRSASRRSL